MLLRRLPLKLPATATFPSGAAFRSTLLALSGNPPVFLSLAALAAPTGPFVEHELVVLVFLALGPLPVR